MLIYTLIKKRGIKDRALWRGDLLMETSLLVLKSGVLSGAG